MDDWESDPSMDSDIEQVIVGDMEDSKKSDDVTVCFSVEELDSVEDRQKGRNRNTRAKIHQSPNLVGYLYVKPEIVPRINRGEELCVSSNLYSKKRRSRARTSSGETDKRDGFSSPGDEVSNVTLLRHSRRKVTDNSPEEPSCMANDDFSPSQEELHDASDTLPTSRRLHAKKFTCSVCGDCFKERSLFLKHRSTHTGQKDLVFVRGRSGIKTQGVKTGEDTGSYPGRRRNITCSSKPVAEKRIQTEAKSYVCKECGKSFTQNASLVVHQRTHTGERPHKCKVCGKSFISGSYLVMHQRVHTGERPYVCNQCGKRFISSSNLIIHQRVHTGEKPYLCKECGKCFGHSSHLVRHEKVHTGERPYTCAECGKAFSRSSHLVRHQTIHMRNPPSQAV
ncbi:uncharacterized protein RCH25_015428 [Pelodytes ibericus]